MRKNKPHGDGASVREGRTFYNGKTVIDFTEKICSVVGLFVEAGVVFAGQSIPFECILSYI